VGDIWPLMAWCASERRCGSRHKGVARFGGRQRKRKRCCRTRKKNTWEDVVATG